MGGDPVFKISAAEEVQAFTSSGTPGSPPRALVQIQPVVILTLKLTLPFSCPWQATSVMAVLSGNTTR